MADIGDIIRFTFLDGTYYEAVVPDITYGFNVWFSDTERISASVGIVSPALDKERISETIDPKYDKPISAGKPGEINPWIVGVIVVGSTYEFHELQAGTILPVQFSRYSGVGGMRKISYCVDIDNYCGKIHFHNAVASREYRESLKRKLKHA